MSETKTVWHPYPKLKPKEEGQYLITLRVGTTDYIDTDSYCINKNHGIFLRYNHFVIAWTELPEPYTGDSC